MIIPIYKSYKFKEGDIIVSLKDMIYGYFMFTVGHEFKIKHIKGSNECDNILTDVENNLTIKIGSLTDFTLKVDLKKANDRNIELNNHYKLIKFISDKCPHKCQRIQDYEYYDSCKIKMGYSDSCVVLEDCISQIDNKTIKKNTLITTLLRNNKIKKIKNGL